MNQGIIDKVKRFVSLTELNNINKPKITLTSYKKKNDTMQLEFDYKDKIIYAEFNMNGDINLMIFNNETKCFTKNILVDTTEKLVSEMMKSIHSFN